MKYQNQILCKVLITPIMLIIMITFCIGLSPLYSKAKTAQPKWKKQLSSLEVGKTYHYQVKHCPKKATIRFSSNHASLASINSKTGMLRAKNAGNVVITAKIKQKQKKTKKLKTHVRIVGKKTETASMENNNSLNFSASGSDDKYISDQSSILDNASFSVAESINPWNHSIMLYSSRILLQSEVENTDLTVTLSAAKSHSKSDFSLKAHFSSLSEDGKTITYQFNSDADKKLCPGNGTSDGIYEITSDFFSNSLQTEYHERICENSICGFVLNTSQASLPNVSVKLYDNSANLPIASTTTDSNGYYEFQDITEKNVTLKVESENYDIYSSPSLNPAGKNICQNIILHPVSVKKLALSCQVLNRQNQPIENTAVILTTKDADISADRLSEKDAENILLQGIVDKNGMISFANQKVINSDEYTRINYYSDQSLPEYFQSEMPVSDTVVYDPVHTLTRKKDYVLYVFPAADGNAIPKDYQMESFSFSFDSLLSDSLFLEIHLQELSLLSTEKTVISSDALADSVSGYHYSLFDTKGNELFQTTLSSLSENEENDYSRQLTESLQDHNIRLADGDYYAAITAFAAAPSTASDSSNGSELPVSGTSILPVQIQKSAISPVNFVLSPCRTFHTLIFSDDYNEDLEYLSFILYQKKDTVWFPVKTCATDSFKQVLSGQKAYLDIPVSSNTSYYLLPLSAQYQISSGNYFTVSEELPNVNLSESENMISSDIPEHQIILQAAWDDSNKLTEDSQVPDLLDYANLCTNRTDFQEDYFSNSTTYPNTIYAYYQADGSFTNLYLSTPSLSSSKNLPSALILDQLQNGKSILTSQQSYSITPFFVT